MFGAMWSRTFFLYEATVDGASRRLSSQVARYSPVGWRLGSL